MSQTTQDADEMTGIVAPTAEEADELHQFERVFAETLRRTAAELQAELARRDLSAEQRADYNQALAMVRQFLGQDGQTGQEQVQ